MKPEKSQGLKRVLINQMRGVKPQSFDQLDRSQDPGLMSPDRERSPEKDRRWFDGNTFSCLDSSCKFSSYCLDNFEKHVQSEHRVSLEAFKVVFEFYVIFIFKKNKFGIRNVLNIRQN